MSASRLEIKVGMFVIVVLGLAAVMTLKFSETGLGLAKTIPLKLRSPSAGAVIANAPIQLSGVKIGVVDKITLNAEGRGVIIHADIFEKYWSHLDRNCTFEIRVTGLMGDEFIAAIPFQERINRSEELKVRFENKLKNAKEELLKIDRKLIEPKERDKERERFLLELRKKARKEVLKEAKENRKLLQDGEERACVAPFDLMAVARDAQQLIRRVDKSMVTLDTAIDRLDQTVLSSETLTNLTIAIAEFKGTSVHIRNIAGSIDTNTVPGINHFVEFLSTNTPALKQGLDDFTRFTKRLDGYADDLEAFAATNRVVIDKIITDLGDISGIVKATTIDLQATFSTNRNDINLIVKDVRKVTADLKKFTEKSNRILDDLEAGKGLAGGLLKDDAMRTEFFQMITNLSTTAKSITRLADKLNEKGLLTKPSSKPSSKPPKSGRPR